MSSRWAGQKRLGARVSQRGQRDLGVMSGGRKGYRIIREMKSIDVYLKVEVDLADGETEERVTKEMVRTLEKMYGVRRAEVTNVVAQGEE
jgi:hypothetical protein